jgi:hypothetical protein
MKHLFLIIFSLFLVVAHSSATPFDGKMSAPFGTRPFEGYQMRSVAPMSEEKTIDNITSPFQLNPSYLSTEPTATTTQSGYGDDNDDEYNEEDGPGVPKVDSSEMIPLTLGWDVILLLISLAFIYAISIAQKRKKTTI